MSKRGIRELRVARGWTQEELARRTGTSQDVISKLERKLLGPSQALLKDLCGAFQCLADELDVAPNRTVGRPAKQEADLLRRFQETPPRLPPPDWTSGMRLNGLRRDLSGWLSKLAWGPSWQPFLDAVGSDSRDETIFHLKELQLGATVTEVTTDWMGFRQWPVVTKAGAGAGSYRRPALATEDWLMTFQVWVQTPRRYRMDALVLVLKPARTFLNLEIDGQGHDPTWDEERANDLAMRAVRIPAHEVLQGPGLTERLRAMGFCSTRRRP